MNSSPQISTSDQFIPSGEKTMVSSPKAADPGPPKLRFWYLDGPPKTHLKHPKFRRYDWMSRV